MYKILFSLAITILSINIATAQNAAAQKVNTDSLALVSKISADQLKLGKLQNTVDQKTSNMQGSAAKAQNAADDNKTAAERLSNNPQDKKLAKNAENKADDAKTDARKARKEEARLNDLNKEISDLKRKIADNQVRLSRFTIQPMSTPALSPIPADTAHQQ